MESNSPIPNITVSKPKINKSIFIIILAILQICWFIKIIAQGGNLFSSLLNIFFLILTCASVVILVTRNERIYHRSRNVLIGGYIISIVGFIILVAGLSGMRGKW